MVEISIVFLPGPSIRSCTFSFHEFLQGFFLVLEHYGCTAANFVFFCPKTNEVFLPSKSVKGQLVSKCAYGVVMGSSWNFLARASPSCEVSELSRAELGHFDFRAEIELTILTICMSKNSDFVPLSWFYVQSYEFI